MEMEFSQAYDPNSWEPDQEASLQSHLDVWKTLYERRNDSGNEYQWSGQELLESFEAHLAERFGIQPYME